MTTYKATYVDDFRSEATKVIKALNAVGGLDVNYLAPLPDLSLAGIRPGVFRIPYSVFRIPYFVNTLE